MPWGLGNRRRRCTQLADGQGQGADHQEAGLASGRRAGRSALRARRRLLRPGARVHSAPHTVCIHRHAHLHALSSHAHTRVRSCTLTHTLMLVRAHVLTPVHIHVLAQRALSTHTHTHTHGRARLRGHFSVGGEGAEAPLLEKAPSGCERSSQASFVLQKEGGGVQRAGPTRRTRCAGQRLVSSGAVGVRGRWVFPVLLVPV